MLAIWFLVSLFFLNPTCTSESSQFMYCWSLAWRILSINLLACEMGTTVWYFECSLALPFFEIEMKTNLFQSYGHCWVFQICWHIGCSTFTVSSFRIWNSSIGIPSPPLALFVVMPPKAHLTTETKHSNSTQALPSMDYLSQEHWSGLPFPPPGNPPNPGIIFVSPLASALAGGFLTTEPAGKPKR